MKGAPLQAVKIARKYAPILDSPGAGQTDDVVSRQEKWVVPQRRLEETDAQFLRRLNQPLVKAKLPRFDGLRAGDESTEILGIRRIVSGEYETSLTLLVSSAGKIHESVVDVHEDGYHETACLVIPFVRASDGQIYHLVTRESRYALYLNKGEMSRPLLENDGKPRGGWVTRYPQAFAASVKLMAIVGARLASVPVHAPRDRARLSRAVKALIGRKAGQVISQPGIEPVAFRYLDTMPENPGKSATCIPVVTLELRFTDPEVERAFLWGDPANDVRPRRFGPGNMRSKFVPWCEIITSKGRQRHGLVCAFTQGAINLFREALEEGRLKEARSPTGEIKKSTT
jgi:hypothetical protein